MDLPFFMVGMVLVVLLKIADKQLDFLLQVLNPPEKHRRYSASRAFPVSGITIGG